MQQGFPAEVHAVEHSRRKNSLCWKAKACSTFKSHGPIQKSSEAGCPCLHSQCYLRILTRGSCKPSCCTADCLDCLTSPTVLIFSKSPTTCISIDRKRRIPAMIIALPGNLSGKTLIYVKLDPRTCRVCGIWPAGSTCTKVSSAYCSCMHFTHIPECM